MLTCRAGTHNSTGVGLYNVMSEGMYIVTGVDMYNVADVVLVVSWTHRGCKKNNHVAKLLTSISQQCTTYFLLCTCDIHKRTLMK